MSFRLPWTDRNGRLAPLKAVAFALLFVPAGLMGRDYLNGLYAPRLWIEFNHAAGDWTIRLLILSLAITPLRQALRWSALIQVRRMIGVAAFVYALAHVAGYALDQKLVWWTIAREIALRIYLTIGFAVLLALAALAATSTDGMVRRIGGKAWRKLHYLAYPAGMLAVVHFFLQAKAGTTEATVLAGILGWLLVWRLLARRSGGLSPLGLLGLSLFAPVATALGEAAYYGLFTGIDPWRVLQANIMQIGERPAWLVLGAGLAVTLLAFVRQFTWARRPVAAGR
ncbi:MAG: ferric reductase-like transmembrane domain-containing protein [Alphaproteobacteria bacterium]|nr:ferric reductase-like transmembrane domain-containing protein [Alphaproteobacteria bacterium]